MIVFVACEIQQVEALSDALYKLYKNKDPMAGVRAMLPEVSLLFRSRHVAFDVVPLGGRGPELLALLNADECAGVTGAYPHVIETSPNLRYVRGGGFAPVLRIQDHVTAREFRDTPFYQEIFRPMGWRDQLGIAICSERELFGLTFQRDSDFSAAEVHVAALLQKHVSHRFAQATPVHWSTHRSREECLVNVGADGMPVVLSERASGVLQRYFSASASGHDTWPESLRSWLRREFARGRRQAYWRIDRVEGTLVIEFRREAEGPRHSVILHESYPRYDFHALRRLGLTERQIAVAFWLVQGKSDSEVALILGVSPRTVSKHVETVLAKLGCSNRTAAAVQLVEWLNDIARSFVAPNSPAPNV
jgi:DNA-binding CsgD family transcriptional regulator